MQDVSPTSNLALESEGAERAQNGQRAAGCLRVGDIVIRHVLHGAQTIAVHEPLANRAHYDVWVQLSGGMPSAGQGLLLIEDRGAASALEGLPLEAVRFEIPFSTLSVFAGRLGRPEYEALATGLARTDLVMLGLSQAMLPSLMDPAMVDFVFVEQLCHTILSYLIEHYGGVYFAPERKGCLSARQEQLATAYLVEHLGESFSLTELASLCGLSPSHFTKAFKKSFGKNPQHWLTDYRVRYSKQLLKGKASIAEIALACGFTDQSHMTRIFSERLGISPGRYRKTQLHFAFQ